MFQSINNGNWGRVESTVNEILKRNREKRLTVFTGTFGILEINGVSLYLAPGSVNRVPIPKGFYKIVIINETRAANVMISTNHPQASLLEIENPQNGFVICRDTLLDNNSPAYFKAFRDARLTALNDSTSAANYVNAGYVYTCGINDFLKGLKNFYGINLKSEINS